jgi:hypothetical protein
MRCLNNDSEYFQLLCDFFEQNRVDNKLFRRLPGLS